MKKYRLVLGIALVFFAAALVALLGAYVATSASPPNQVKITLSDFKIQASQTTFLAGTTYHFVVTNTGHINHEFMVMQPTMSGQMSMDQMDQLALYHIDQSQLPPGASKSFDFTFPATATSEPLELACHLTGHYEMGMHLAIMVKQ